MVGVACVHEWSHISDQDDPPELDCEPTEAEQQQHACDECKAHCKALMSMYVRFLLTEHKPTCTVKTRLVQDMEVECHVCAMGVNGIGPPPDMCAGVDAVDVPCTP